MEVQMFQSPLAAIHERAEKKKICYSHIGI